MRSVARNALSAAALAIVSLAWSGCDAKKQTEYVAGFSTQMTVPRDIASVVVIVSVGGVNVFCQPYQVYNQRVLLPRSLGEFPASGTVNGNPLTVSVIGLTDVTTDQSGNPFVSDCSFTSQTVDNPMTTARILRRSRQPYLQDQVLFLPMPLRYSCMDVECSNQDTTCKAGRCANVDTDPASLPLFRDELLDGTGAACFSSSLCFAAAVPAVPVDPDNCIYALPNTPSAPPLLPGAPPDPITSAGNGINVEITYDSGLTKEILDLDPVEGFSLPDATKPQRFQLTAGLCDLVKGYDASGNPTAHRITSVRATGVCQAKGVFQPLCADDQNNAMGTPGGISPSPDLAACKAIPLTPAKSELIILADNSANNEIFYTAKDGGAGDVALSPLISAALKNPAFRNTYIGLTYYPGDETTMCGPHPPAIAPELTHDPKKNGQGAQQDIAASLDDLGNHPETLKGAGTPLYLSSAMNEAYTLLHNVTDANRRAVFIIGNRSFDDATCTDTPAHLAANAFATDKVITYLGVLARDPTVPQMTPWPPLPGENELAAAGDAPAKSPIAYDTRGKSSADQQGVATNALTKLVNDLGTCAYDFKTAPDDTAVLAYSDPLAVTGNKFHTINHAAAGACTDNDGTGDGWNFVTDKNGNKRVIVCGPSCASYQTTFNNAAKYTALYGEQGPDVPLFAYTPACQPKN